MWILILKALYFFLPAGAANMWPSLLARFPGFNKLNQPLDFSLTYKGKRVFGSNKTWRGIISGVVSGVVICWLQRWLMSVDVFRNISIVDYYEINIFLLGGCLGAGAILGDAVESFFKRQKGVNPGQSWFPWDQLDYIIGGSLFSLMVIRLDWYYYLLILIIYFVLHLISKVVGKFLGLNKNLI